jgi:hypothetical protein
VFLSYKRNVEPDQTLAREIEAGLSAAGVAVFIDHRLLVGQAWAEEIEQQVRGSDYLIVFLTAESGRSEMVRGEIEIARRAAATHAAPRILPVRVAYDGPLPYPLNAYLDSIQYAVWNEPADTSTSRRRSARGILRLPTQRRFRCRAARSMSTTPGISRVRATTRRCLSSPRASARR